MVFLVALQQFVRLARSSYKGVTNGLNKNWGLAKIMSAELQMLRISISNFRQKASESLFGPRLFRKCNLDLAVLGSQSFCKPLRFDSLGNKINLEVLICA